ncbi:MAG TPA: uroporphyrinogen-III C-methyltransferase [Puia sp.]|jgi:uroporphyrin-III C-methyltransferase|nr:uroporphyrinogen-III C-methyltransferase [Puia sp.]
MNSVPPASSELILIGAGPGDPELITVKAWKALQRADIILYDHLANTALLEMARPGCERICVGKRPYQAAITQEEIHQLIRQKAAKGGMIIRLKGGDPFIFGRGFEEVLFARQLGLRVTYIPGITSMQTAGLLDIPLTHRAISESIWIVTGTKKDGSLSADLRLALQSKATVVIYMGMKKLPEIAALYRDEGAAGMPAAIIQHGSWTCQRVAVGTAGSLVELAAMQELSHPAIIVIGEVVGLGAAAEQKSHRTVSLFQLPPAAII